MDEILAVRGLSKNYRDFALTDVSFSLPKGYIMGLIGPNGAGKTTTIRLILGLIHADGGSVELLGRPPRQQAVQAREEVGGVFDTICFPENWKAGDVDRYAGGFYESWDKKKFQDCLRDFGLPRDKKMKELSRGMQMKLMMACALSHNARLLLLDEPTSGLDPVSRDELLELLLDFIGDGERSVLFSTHITSDLEKIADYITFLRQGKVLYTGPKDALLEGCRVIRGGPGELNPEIRAAIVGLKENALGFEGLMPAETAARFPGLQSEPASLDEIMIYTCRREKNG